MEWADEAVVLGVRAHGEHAMVLDVLTRAHGRHAGLVRGGASRKARADLQPGNSLHVVWRARLAEHLGSFVTQPIRHRWVRLSTLIAADATDWRALYVRGEVGLLTELGFGLDLSCCAATGVREDLTHVSPKSGRAVSSSAAAPYRDRLLKLPAFLLGAQNAVAPADIQAGLALTEHFLAHRVFHPHGQDLPAARLQLHDLMARLGRL